MRRRDRLHRRAADVGHRRPRTPKGAGGSMRAPSPSRSSWRAENREAPDAGRGRAGFAAWAQCTTQDHRGDSHIKLAAKRGEPGREVLRRTVLQRPCRAERPSTPAGPRWFCCADEALPLAEVDSFLARTAARGVRVFRPLRNDAPLRAGCCAPPTNGRYRRRIRGACARIAASSSTAPAWPPAITCAPLAAVISACRRASASRPSGCGQLRGMEPHGFPKPTRSSSPATWASSRLRERDGSGGGRAHRRRSVSRASRGASASWSRVLHGLDGLGRGRDGGAARRARDRRASARGGVHRVGRRAHAGGSRVAHADGEGVVRAGAPCRGEASLHLGAHRSHDGRRDRVVRHAGRRDSGRAARADRLRRASASSGHHQAGAARGLPDGRVRAAITG